MLMEKTTISPDDIALDRLHEQYHVILDRIIGGDGENGSRSIPRILRGIVAKRHQPSPTTRMPWTRMSSGTETAISVRHAVDFTHYFDGNRSVPDRIAPTFGSSFDDDPQASRIE